MQIDLKSIYTSIFRQRRKNFKTANTFVFLKANIVFILGWISATLSSCGLRPYPRRGARAPFPNRVYFTLKELKISTIT